MKIQSSTTLHNLSRSFKYVTLIAFNLQMFFYDHFIPLPQRTCAISIVLFTTCFKKLNIHDLELLSKYE